MRVRSPDGPRGGDGLDENHSFAPGVALRDVDAPTRLCPDARPTYARKHGVLDLRKSPSSRRSPLTRLALGERFPQPTSTP